MNLARSGANCTRTSNDKKMLAKNMRLPLDDKRRDYNTDNKLFRQVR